jgi:cobalt-precorrin 5A hydrolase
MKVRLVAFTSKGAALALGLMKLLSQCSYSVEGFSKTNVDGLFPLKTDIKTFAKESFDCCDAVVFIGAAGIAVRAIAPFIISKNKDPAVIVIDETGRFVIPILSGHIGGANELAEKIAVLIGAVPVITTATDINHLFAADVWATAHNCHICDISEIKYISAAVLRGEQVGLNSEFPVAGQIPQELILANDGKIGISISHIPQKSPFEHTLRLVPKQYVVGIGCRKGVDPQILQQQFINVLKTNQIPIEAIDCIATIDIKVNEPAINILCNKYNFKLKTFSADELSQVSGDFTVSDFVKSVTGVDNVCERAAVRVSNGKLMIKKSPASGVTIAVAKSEWRCDFEHHNGFNRPYNGTD